MEAINSLTPVSIETLKMITSDEALKLRKQYVLYEKMRMMLTEYEETKPFLFFKKKPLMEWLNQKVSALFGYKIERYASYYSPVYDGFIYELRKAIKYSSNGTVYCSEEWLNLIERISDSIDKIRYSEEIKKYIEDNKEVWEFLLSKRKNV
jgi:hypothetical protein